MPFEIWTTRCRCCTSLPLYLPTPHTKSLSKAYTPPEGSSLPPGDADSHALLPRIGSASAIVLPVVPHEQEYSFVEALNRLCVISVCSFLCYFCSILCVYTAYLLLPPSLFARLCLEWQAYVTRTHALRKTFVSVKGTYYQVKLPHQTRHSVKVQETNTNE